MTPRPTPCSTSRAWACSLAGLADRSLLSAEAGDDRLHQSERARLFPEAPELLARLDQGRGAHVVLVWGRAEPAGICDGAAQAARVREAGRGGARVAWASPAAPSCSRRTCDGLVARATEPVRLRGLRPLRSERCARGDLPARSG